MVNPPRTYEEAFRKMLKGKNLDLAERIRFFVFAAADPDCPLHYYVDHPPAQEKFAYLVAEKDEVKRSSRVRDMSFMLSGQLGLLREHSKNEPVRFASAEDGELEAIILFRLQLETDAFQHLYRRRDKSAVLEDMKERNGLIEAVSKRLSDELLDPKKAIDHLDRRFAHWANDFWRHDADFHMLPFEKGHVLGAGIIHMLLERMRLTACSIQTILRRIPSAFEQHKALLNVLENGPDEGAVADLVKRHLESTASHFGASSAGSR